MRTVNGARLTALALGFGLVFPCAYSYGSSPSLARFATTAAASVAAASPAKPASARPVARPKKAARAKGPPAGAQRSSALSLDKSVKWKTDPKSHSVFAVGSNKQVWFLDPSSGWPYTIDGKGIIYTSDPLTGYVYSLGKLSSWVGDVLYIFGFWDYAGGSYKLPNFDSYYNIYVDTSYEYYAYDAAYAEVWEYEEYFTSEEFIEETVEIESFDEADKAADEADDAEDDADEAEDEADDAEDDADEAEDEADDAEDEADEEEDDSGDDE